MKALVKSFAIFSVLLSSVALAHEAIEIKSSTPSKNAMLMEAPMELSVSFTKGVRLIACSGPFRSPISVQSDH